MTDDLGWVDLGVRPDTTGFGTSLSRQINGDMTSAGRSAGARFSAGFKRAAAAGALGAGVLALKVGADSIEQASTLNESLNAVNVTYEKQAKAVQRLGEQSAESLGLSNSEFNSLAVRFSAFSTTIAGGPGKAVVTTLDDLTTRAADFASVMNLDVNEAATLFQSGLAGETEPLRRYGLDMSAAAVEAHALATGIADGTGELTEAEKIQSRYSLLMKQTSKTQGDFAKTSDELANRQRILSARWDDAQATLGTALLPIMEDFVGFVVDDGLPAFEKFSDWFVEDGIPALKDVAEFGGDAAGAIKDLVGFLNDLPDPAKYAGLAALLGGGAALKLRGGGGGALGTAGAALGLAKGQPVYVTNWAMIKGGPDVPVVTGGTTPSKLGKAAKFAGKAFLPATLFAAGYELGGDEFGSGAKDSGLLGSNYSIMDGAARTRMKEQTDGLELLTEKTLGLSGAIKEVPQLRKVDILTPNLEKTMDLVERFNRQLDHATRPREVRIKQTIEYAEMGYETRGGLQEFGGGPVAPRNAGGFGP